MDWQGWIKQSLPRTEIMRGGATVWVKGAQGLIGDTLGPVFHLHDGASEIFYFPSGKCRLEVGDTDEYFGPCDFVLVPPGVPHNLWNAGDDDLLVFWIVAPHRMENKWRTEEIAAEDMQRRASRARVEPGAALPSDANIHTRLLEFQSGEGVSLETLLGQEAVIYISSGQADVRVGKLSGRLQANQFVHVPVGTDFSVKAVGGAASVLLFEMPWKE
jgi:mannose-6-phosphate isomerase-like protein (cupin superfamily)